MKLTAYDMAKDKAQPKEIKTFTKQAIVPNRAMLDDLKSMKAKEFGAKYKISHATVTRLRKEAGIKANIEWTQAKINKIEEMLAEGSSNNAIGRHFGVAGSTIVSVLARNGRTTTNAAYNSGSRARSLGKPSDSCPYGTARLELRHWWLAGWHDRDMIDD